MFNRIFYFILADPSSEGEEADGDGQGRLRPRAHGGAPQQRRVLPDGKHSPPVNRVPEATP